jgi:hypothetical protein
MMYEDANVSIRNIYIAYPDFKCVFGGMDHQILFQLIEDYYGFQDSYIASYRQLYSVSKTYYMTIHGNTAPLPIYRGTLKRRHTFFLPLHNIHGIPPTMASSRKPRV